MTPAFRHESGQRSAMLCLFFWRNRAHGMNPGEWLEDLLN